MSKFWKKIFTSKYTGKQIDEVVGKVLDGDVGMTNPMTAAGDIIIGGTDGEPEKLAKGTDGKVLKMVSGAPGWADDAGGMENPMTAAGDMIIGGADGTATRLPKGTDGQVLTVASGAPVWAAASGGGAEHLYEHTITYFNTGSSANYFLTFQIITDTATLVDSIYNLTSKIWELYPNKPIPCIGFLNISTGGAADGFWTISQLKMLQSTSTNVRVYGVKFNGSTYTFSNQNGPDINIAASESTITTRQIF